MFTGNVGGTYQLGDPLVTVPGARATRFHLSTRKLTAHVPDTVAMLNNAACLSGAWQQDQERDIKQPGCLFMPCVSTCPTENDLLLLDGRELFLGDRSQDLCKAEVQANARNANALSRQ